jgi:hypothetical protein
MMLLAPPGMLTLTQRGLSILPTPPSAIFHMLLLTPSHGSRKWLKARDEIYGFVDHLNNDLSRKNDFDKDFIMKYSFSFLTGGFSKNLNS